VAVVPGIIRSEGFGHLFFRDAANSRNDHPLAMFPADVVPIFPGCRVIAIARVRREARRWPNLWLSAMGLVPTVIVWP
jgi:hypothetical protein